MEVHQVDPAHRLVVGGEADLERLDAERAAKLAEDLLRVEVAPDRRAVVVRRVGVPAAHDEIREAEVLAVDRVHHRLLGPAVEHLDVEAEEDHPIGHRLAARSPERRIAVAVAERAGLEQRLVGAHAHLGPDVVFLGLADERHERRPGVVAGAEERLEGIDQRVLVRAVERVARLEGDGAIPALGAQQRPHLARGAEIAAEGGVRRLWQRADRPAEQVGLVGVGLEHHVGAGVVHAVGLVDAAEVLALVPRVDVREVERRHDLARAVRKCHPFARPEPLGERARDRERDRDRPRPAPAPVLDHGLVEDAVVGGGVHRPLERTQGAVGEAVDAREVGVGHRDPRQRGRLGEKGRALGRWHRAIDGLGEPAVGRDQVGHRGRP